MPGVPGPARLGWRLARIGALALLLIALMGGTVLWFREVDRLRAEVSLRAGWLAVLATEAAGGPGAEAELEALRAEIQAAPGVGPAARTAAEAWAPGVSGGLALQRALREEVGGRSVQLGSRLDQLQLVLLGGGALAGLALLLGVGLDAARVRQAAAAGRLSREVQGRARAERELMAQRELVEGILRAMPLGVQLYEVDGRPGPLNARGAALLGRGGEGEWSVGYRLDGPDLLRELQLSDAIPKAAAGQPSTLRGLSLPTRGGPPRRVDVGVFAAGEGSVRRVVALVEDRTGQAEMEDRLLRVERFAAVGRMAAGVAHEVNNPLTFALGACAGLDDLLSPGAPLTPDDHTELQTLLVDLRAGLERIRRVTRDLAQLASARDGGKRPVHLAAAARLAARMAAHEIEHRASFVVDVPNLPPVEADPERLGQVLVNLLTNAARAIPEGDPASHQVTLRGGTDPRGDPWIEVRDTGVGIPLELQERVFEPFFTTRRGGEGTGLGLSLVRAFVEELGGRLSLESQPGRGTCFRLHLPKTEITALPDTPDGTSPIPMGLRVLVVDDERRVPGAVRALGLPVEVQGCGSGREALQLLDEDIDRDIILCDVMMPGLSGPALWQAVGQRWPALARRFVFMTGGAFVGELSAEARATGQPLVEKPFDRRAVQEAFATLLMQPATGRPPPG